MDFKFIDSMIPIVQRTSTDAQTKVGCVITDSSGNVISMGSNRHTDGMPVTEENSHRPGKYSWIEHAERNAIYSAARRGVSLNNSRMHIPGYPCVECARAIVQSGVKELVCGIDMGVVGTHYNFDEASEILKHGNVTITRRNLESV